MTRPSGARWSSVSSTSASHWRLVTSNTEPRRLEATSSGRNTRKLLGLASPRLAGTSPGPACLSESCPGLGHRYPYSRKSGNTRSRRSGHRWHVGLRSYDDGSWAAGRPVSGTRAPLSSKSSRAGSCATTTPAPPGGRVGPDLGQGYLNGNARALGVGARRQTWGRSSLWAKRSTIMGQGPFRSPLFASARCMEVTAR